MTLTAPNHYLKQGRLLNKLIHNVPWHLSQQIIIQDLKIPISKMRLKVVRWDDFTPSGIPKITHLFSSDNSFVCFMVVSWYLLSPSLIFLASVHSRGTRYPAHVMHVSGDHTTWGDKQRFLTPGHQGWNDLHSLCRIGMEYYLLNNNDNNNKIFHWGLVHLVQSASLPQNSPKIFHTVFETLPVGAKLLPILTPDYCHPSQSNFTECKQDMVAVFYAPVNGQWVD